MRRIVILPAADLVARFQSVLADHLGGELAFTVIRPVLNALMDLYCHGKLKDSWKTSIRSELISWGVPESEATQAETTLVEELYGLIQAGFKVVYPSRSYRYYWLNQSDLVVVEETKPLELLVEVEVELHEGYDHGYVPRRYRGR